MLKFLGGESGKKDMEEERNRKKKFSNSSSECLMSHESLELRIKQKRRKYHSRKTMRKLPTFT